MTPTPRLVPDRPIAWFTDDHLTDKSATTYDPAVAERWRNKGWPVTPLYTAAPPAEAPAERGEAEESAENLQLLAEHRAPDLSEDELDMLTRASATLRQLAAAPAAPAEGDAVGVVDGVGRGNEISIEARNDYLRRFHGEAVPAMIAALQAANGGEG